MANGNAGHNSDIQRSEFCQGVGIKTRLTVRKVQCGDYIMTTRLYGLCGALVIMGVCCGGSAFAGPRDTEEVTVRPPYTIRVQPLAHNLSGLVQEARTTVESNVSYADLDFSQQADVDTMRDRLKEAARDNCRKAYRNPHAFGYIPTDEAACIRGLTLQTFAELDTIRADASRYARRQSAMK
jgi:UrcA family protein